ncbi:MAG: tetratricopeptide repeat protein [Phycisphaerales bacterium]
MTTTRTHATTLALAAIAMFSGSCETAPVFSAAQNPQYPTTSQASAAMPVSSRDRREQEKFQEAIRGLNFSAGLVEVEAFTVRNAERALQRATQGAELLEVNRRTEAIKAYADAVRNAPDLAELYHGLGDALISDAKDVYALAAFRSAVEIDPDFVEARFSLAITLSMINELDSAIEHMQRVVQLDPEHGLAHERLAVWHYYAQDYAKAWQETHSAQDLGHAMPPQFLALLEAHAPEPKH